MFARRWPRFRARRARQDTASVKERAVASELRVGIIGCGGISRAHARGWLTVAGQARVTALADIDQANLDLLTERLGGGVAQYRDYRELLAGAGVDVVDICLPHHLHKEAIVAAAEAGKHILCEKPLCLNLEEAAACNAAIERAGITFMAAHNTLFMPSLQAARKRLDAGALGQVYMLYCADNFVSGGGAPPPLTWRSKIATKGGGELIDTGYHPTYRLLYLADAPPAAVTAMSGRYRIHHWEGEDTAQVMVRFADGVIGTILSSWAMDLPLGRYWWYANGERGQMYGTDDTLFVKEHGFDEPAAKRYPPVDTYVAEIQHFTQCLHSGRRPIHTNVEATEALRLILAAYRSIETGRTVEVTPATTGA
jgi:predicted dehydrogenase